MKSINEINLNEEYMDASVVITMNWNDKQLAWKTGKLLESSTNLTTDKKLSSDQKMLKIPLFLTFLTSFQLTKDKYKQYTR